MEKYRYPGTQPFSTSQKHIFFGRKKDIEDLYRHINLERMVVLYAKSGLGKSSLLNAGIVPEIEADGRYTSLNIRFGAYQKESEETPLFLTKAAIRSEATTPSILNKLIPEEDSLWSLVKQQQFIAKGAKDYLLIFDQFEELFTYPEQFILEFKRELAELVHTTIPHRFREIVEQRIKTAPESIDQETLDLLHTPFDLKVVMAIRSDRMSLLNGLSDYLPTILKNCYELRSLSPEQAEDAILSPAYMSSSAFLAQPFDYEDEAIETILKFLTKDGDNSIESFQLQILCQSIERKVIEQNLSQVSLEDLGNVEEIYENYYDNEIRLIGNAEEQQLARSLIEEGLIFAEEQRRLSLYEGRIYKDFGVSPDLLARLVDSHLLRAEPSLKGGFTYELSHDTLVPPVLKSREKRTEIEQKKAAEQADRARLKELEEARAQALQEKKEKGRARRLAALGFLLAFISLATSIFAFSQYQKVKQAQQEISLALEKAEEEKRKADAALSLADEQRLLADEQRREAEAQTLLAQEAEAFAIVAEELAILEQKKALTALEQARKAELEAKQQTVLAESNGLLALAYSEKEEDQTLAMRLAERAYYITGRQNQRASALINEILDQPMNPFYERSIFAHSNPVRDAAFSKDGQWFATAGNGDGLVKIWNINGQLICTLEGHGNRVSAIDFHKEREFIVTGGADGRLLLWKIDSIARTGDIIHSFNNGGGEIYDMAFSNSGNFLLTGTRDGIPRLWYANPTRNDSLGILVQQYTGNVDAPGHNSKDRITSVAFASDDSFIITGSTDNTARIWQLDGTLQHILDTKGKGKDIHCVALSNNKAFAATGGLDSKIRIWSLFDKQNKLVLDSALYELSLHETVVSKLIFSPDDKYLVSTGGDKAIQISNVNIKDTIIRTPRRKYGGVFSLRGHKSTVSTLAYSEDGKRLISGDRNGNLLIWKPFHSPMLEERDIQPNASIRYSSATLSPDKNQMILLSNKGKRLVAVDIDTRKEVWTYEFENEVWGLISSSNKELLLCYGPAKGAYSRRKNFIYILNFNGELLHKIENKGLGFSRGAIWGPDNKSFITYGDDASIRIWSFENKLLQTLKGHSIGVKSVKLASDGKTIISSGSDNRIIVWGQDGRPLQKIALPKGNVRDFHFSLEKQQLVIIDSRQLSVGKLIPGRSFQTNEVRPFRLNRLYVSPDEQYVIGHNWNELFVLNQAGQKLMSFQGSFIHLEFSNEGRYLSTISETGSIQKWQLPYHFMQSEGIAQLNLLQRLNAQLEVDEKTILSLENYETLYTYAKYYEERFRSTRNKTDLEILRKIYDKLLSKGVLRSSGLKKLVLLSDHLKILGRDTSIIGLGIIGKRKGKQLNDYLLSPPAFERYVKRAKANVAFIYVDYLWSNVNRKRNDRFIKRYKTTLNTYPFWKELTPLEYLNWISNIHSRRNNFRELTDFHLEYLVLVMEKLFERSIYLHYYNPNNDFQRLLRVLATIFREENNPDYLSWTEKLLQTSLEPQYVRDRDITSWYNLHRMIKSDLNLYQSEEALAKILTKYRKDIVSAITKLDLTEFLTKNTYAARDYLEIIQLGYAADPSPANEELVIKGTYQVWNFIKEDKVTLSRHSRFLREIMTIGYGTNSEDKSPKQVELCQAIADTILSSAWLSQVPDASLFYLCQGFGRPNFSKGDELGLKELEFIERGYDLLLEREYNKENVIRQYSNICGNSAWDLLHALQFDVALRVADKGLTLAKGINSYREIELAYSNLVTALLFTGKVRAAKKMYLDLIDKPLREWPNHDSYRAMFLSDLNKFEITFQEKGVYLQYKERIDMIKMLLKQ